MIWYKDKNDDDIVISTRIRLARNLENYPFVNAISKEGAKKCIDEIKNAISGSNSTLANDFLVYDMQECDEIQKNVLLEKHLISPDLLKRPIASCMISKDEQMSIMLMEEDHIRIQVILSGNKLFEAYKTATRVDDVIDENTQYAFDAEFGYLTSCPTNTGTGMRASVMMHLPALTMTDNIQKVISSASNLGIALRGLYGEGSKAYGSLYQISNQVTLGSSEEDIIQRVENITNQIVKLEKEARQKLLENNKTYIEDRIFRAYGILKYARQISSKEAKTLISDVLMGKSMGIINTDQNLTELMIMTEPASIELFEKSTLTPTERDIKRANIIRDKI